MVVEHVIMKITRQRNGKNFIEYNKRDVEVELAIKKRLQNFPVPNFVWDEYHLDQNINDCGIGVDVDFVQSAIKIDAESKAKNPRRIEKF